MRPQGLATGSRSFGLKGFWVRGCMVLHVGPSERVRASKRFRRSKTYMLVTVLRTGLLISQTRLLQSCNYLRMVACY